MTDKAWKAWERTVAAIFGGKRRGAYTGSNGHGKSDVIMPGWGIECKLLSNPDYQAMLEAARQAEKNRDHPGDIPIAVIKRKGGRTENALVIMRMETFREFFVNQPIEES